MDKVELSALDRKILNYLQEEIPLEMRPFKILSKKIGIKEDALLNKLKTLKRKGIIRRFSASLTHRKLGFKSTLLALRVSEDKLKGLVKKIVVYPEVTHCYIRKNEYNLWLVFIYRGKTLKKFLKSISSYIGRENILDLKTIREFKLNTRIDV